MPRVSYLQTNFSAGEFAPKVHGRVDLARYQHGAKSLANVIVFVTGGAMRRPGSRYRGAAKVAAKKARLIPFVLNKAAAYVVEFGDLYVRFWKDGAPIGAPLELASPYAEAELPDVDYSQDAGTMYLFHPSHMPYRLRRFSDTAWDLTAAPFTTTPFAEIGRRPATDCTLSLATVGAGRTATTAGNAFEPTDVGRAITYRGGVAVITAYTSATQVTVEITIAFETVNLPAGDWKMDISPQTDCTPSAASPVGASITLTLAAAGWRAAEDVGKFVRINSGLVKITGVTSTTIADGAILKELSSATAAPALAWSLESSVWNATDGYPRTGTLFEQRLVAAGSTGYPQTVWGSRIGESLDFTLGTNDDEGFSFTLQSDETNQIAYLTASRNLLALSYGGAFSLRGGVEKPITPTNVQVKPESNYGAATVRPTIADTEVLFVQRAGKRVRGMSYRYETDRYQSPDVSVLSDHLLASGVVELVFQQEPHPLLWAALGDGTLAVCTFDRDQEVVAWTPQDVGGFVESVCVIPTATAEQVWLLVRRTINGAPVRYLETIDFETEGDDLDMLCMDCAKVQAGAASATWGSLSHLEGEAVAVKADGVAMPAATVSAGSITLPRTATNVEVGLAFAPTIVLLTPELGTQTGSAQADAMSTSEITLQVLDSIGVVVNGKTVAFRKFGAGILDRAPEKFTGKKRIENLGWARGENEVTITQAEPYPLHLLAVVRRLTTNDG